jgi:hypothetical protein
LAFLHGIKFRISCLTLNLVLWSRFGFYRQSAGRTEDMKVEKYVKKN